MTDISRSRVEELRAEAVKEREQHMANVNAVSGAIQILDLLLAPKPEKTKKPK